LIAAYARAMSGFVAYGLGEYSLAEQLIEERLPVLRRIGKLWGLVFSLAYLSNILAALGKDKEAEGVLREGLAISREMGDRWAVADCLRRLGSLLTAGAEAEREGAKPLLVEGVAIFREIDDPWGLTTILNQLGQTCGVLGDYEASWQYLTEALQLAHQSGLTPIVLDILVNLAELNLQAKALQRPETKSQIEALDLLALVINHPAGEQASKDRARCLLGEQEARGLADQVVTAGSSYTLEARVAEILEKG
jgi:tetratricopeptide (TPR) repeat protein